MPFAGLGGGIFYTKRTKHGGSVRPMGKRVADRRKRTTQAKRSRRSHRSR